MKNINYFWAVDKLSTATKIALTIAGLTLASGQGWAQVSGQPGITWTTAPFGYSCWEPPLPAVETILSGPHGNWKPWHNTNNYVLKVVPGNDYFQHKNNPNKRVSIRCNGNSFGSGNALYRVDWWGNKDKCVIFYYGIPGKSYAPTCKVSSVPYSRQDGMCLNSPNRAIPNLPPNKYVVPFHVGSFCKTNGKDYAGGRIGRATLIYNRPHPIRVRNADKLSGLGGRNLNCPAGEKYNVRTKISLQDAPWGAGVGQFVFNVPSQTSRAYFSASVKPTSNVTSFLSEHLGFMITDSENGGSGHHMYFPQNGPAKDIGVTAYSAGSVSEDQAIFQDRWETEVVPNFVQFGVPISPIVNSGDGNTTKIVARFGGTRGPAPRTIVEKGKLEYCAPLTMQTEQAGPIVVLPKPGPTGPVRPNGPVATPRKVLPKCLPGEVRYPVGSILPVNWKVRRVTAGGKTILCAKPVPYDTPQKPTDTQSQTAVPKPDKPAPRCRKGEKLYTSQQAVPRGWRYRIVVKNRRRVWCAKPTAVKPLKCGKGEIKVGPGVRPPYGKLLVRKRRGKQVVWCLKRDPAARPPRCQRGERLFRHLRKIPRSWTKRAIRKGRYTFYCAKRIQKTCPKGYRAIGRKCVRDILFQFPKPGHLIPGLTPRGEPRTNTPRQIKCPHGTRPYKGRCIKG